MEDPARENGQVSAYNPSLQGTRRKQRTPERCPLDFAESVLSSISTGRFHDLKRLFFQMDTKGAKPA
jgi:hypothetical protein